VGIVEVQRMSIRERDVERAVGQIRNGKAGELIQLVGEIICAAG